jgi:hypothetical protein
MLPSASLRMRSHHYACQRHCRHLRRRVPEHRIKIFKDGGWDPLAHCWAFDGGGLLYLHCRNKMDECIQQTKMKLKMRYTIVVTEGCDVMVVAAVNRNTTATYCKQQQQEQPYATTHVFGIQL